MFASLLGCKFVVVFACLVLSLCGVVFACLHDCLLACLRACLDVV